MRARQQVGEKFLPWRVRANAAGRLIKSDIYQFMVIAEQGRGWFEKLTLPLGASFLHAAVRIWDACRGDGRFEGGEHGGSISRAARESV